MPRGADQERSAVELPLPIGPDPLRSWHGSCLRPAETEPSGLTFEVDLSLPVPPDFFPGSDTASRCDAISICVEIDCPIIRNPVALPKELNVSLSTHPTLPPASGHPAQAWGSLAAVRERLARMDAALDPASPTAQAALILLAGLRMEHNVVKIANFAGLKVELVARCARRLVDNGVWRSGETLCSWRIDGADHAAFWADVAVAEGKLCRRLDESGRPEWAPGGHWWKSFDLVRQSQVDRVEQSVLYYSPPPVTVAEPVHPETDTSEWDESDAGDLTGAKSVSPVSEESDVVSWGPWEAVDSDPLPRAESRTPESTGAPAAEESPSNVEADGAGSGKAVTELFPGAVWL